MNGSLHTAKEQVRLFLRNPVAISTLCMVCLHTHVDIWGTYHESGYDTGYLAFEDETPLFHGNIVLPEVLEGVELETRTPSHILLEDYLDEESGKVSPQAIMDKIIEVQQVETAHIKQYCMEREEDCSPIPDNRYERWLGRRSHVAYRFVNHHLLKAYHLATNLATGGMDRTVLNSTLPEALAFRSSLFQALEVYESLKLDEAGITKRTNGLNSIMSMIKYHRRKHRITANRPEAANLLVPDSLQDQYPAQRFFSPAQAAALPFEAALLDPPNSGFWRKPTTRIRNFDTSNYNGQGAHSLSRRMSPGEISDLMDRDTPLRVVYEEDDLDGRTPKVTVRIGRQNWKIKYATHRRAIGPVLNPARIYQKRFLGAEIGVEPVVNNLAAAIGYSIDPTYYKEKVHFYLQDENYEGSSEVQDSLFHHQLTEVIKTLDASFPGANVASAFQNIQVDEEGRRYVELRQVSLEKKSDAETDVNIGYFTRAGFGKSFKREYRAFGVFLAWISDPDIKDANVKAKLVPVVQDGVAGHILVHSASDMGGALGTGFPNLFKKDLVARIERSETGRFESLEFTFRSIFPAPMLAVVSYQDARWIARLIGQLSREQVIHAFLAAGHPEVVAIYYADILLRRRDQLMEAVGLMGESFPDEQGEAIAFAPLSRMEDPGTYHVPGYEELFKGGKLRYDNDVLFEPETGYFPRYWGTRYPW